MISARWNKAGHMSAMILMFNGEFSAPIMNIHLILEKAMEQECCKGLSWLPTLYAYNEQLFSVVYLICRVAIAPFVIAHISYQLLLTKKGRSEVPLWLSICWMPMCWVRYLCIFLLLVIVLLCVYHVSLNNLTLFCHNSIAT